MNRLKTKEDKLKEHYQQMNELYKKDSLDAKWFFIIIAAALIFVAIIENI